jgi:glycosyltransferase involved in cell wall biosynthesis
VTAPTVTVLMAVHDGERHLRESVESILRQTYSGLELLVVDDASTDSSRSIVESYGDPRVRVLVNERNLGLTASLNRGLEEARGRYVARQDADDVSEPSRLERQVELLERRPDLALVASHYRRIDDEGRHGGDRFVPTSPLDIRWRLLFLNAFAHSSVTFRLDEVRALGGFDERFRYAQDYELWSRLARSHQLTAVPEILVSYRRSSESLTATFDRAGEEIREISGENLRALDFDPARLDRDAAWRLLFGDPSDIPPEHAVEVARATIGVQAAFARTSALDERTARRHRANVGRRLGSRLVRLGLQRRNGVALAYGGRLLAAVAVARYARG